VQRYEKEDFFKTFKMDKWLKLPIFEYVFQTNTVLPGSPYDVQEGRGKKECELICNAFNQSHFYIYVFDLRNCTHHKVLYTVNLF
jgi:hypothetical protein